MDYHKIVQKNNSKLPFKTRVNWLFNDIWCYLVTFCFDWKIGVFQQTVLRVYCILRLFQWSLKSIFLILQGIIQEFNLGVSSCVNINLWCKFCSWWVFGGAGAVTPRCKLPLFCDISLFCYTVHSLKQCFSQNLILIYMVASQLANY